MPFHVLARQILTTRLFGALDFDQLVTLLESAEEKTATAGTVVISPEKPLQHHLIVLDGEAEVERTWKQAGEHEEKSYRWVLKPYDQEAEFGFISAASRGLQARAIGAIRYLLVDADRIDRLSGWSQQFADLVDSRPELQSRIKLVMQTSIFSRLPLENARTAFERLTRRSVQAGETVISQGDEGDAYYILEEGEAEVIRIDPLTDQLQRVLLISAGDAVGEEALIQNGYRNATVTMTTPGKLLVLGRADFEELVKPCISSNIDANSARQLLRDGSHTLIDCRYDMEYEDSRIPRALFVPLDRIRFEANGLDPDGNYIVYCRSGRRSQAAAYLLRERNINAVSLNGGLKNWPYDIDMSPLSLG